MHEFHMYSTKRRGMIVDGLGNTSSSSLKINGRIDSFGGRAILQEENKHNGKVLAVIIRERIRGRQFAYKLLSRTPLYPSQKAHRMRINYYHQQFYEHMTIQRTSYFSNNFVIHCVGNDNDEEKENSDNNIDYVVRESSGFGRPLQLKVYEKDSNMCRGAVRQFFEHGNASSSSWQVQADKDICPKIMICLTAIASKSLGKLYDD